MYIIDSASLKLKILNNEIMLILLTDEIFPLIIFYQNTIAIPVLLYLVQIICLCFADYNLIFLFFIDIYGTNFNGNSFYL